VLAPARQGGAMSRERGRSARAVCAPWKASCVGFALFQLRQEGLWPIARAKNKTWSHAKRGHFRVRDGGCAKSRLRACCVAWRQRGGEGVECFVRKREGSKSKGGRSYAKALQTLPRSHPVRPAAARLSLLCAPRQVDALSRSPLLVSLRRKTNADASPPPLSRSRTSDPRIDPRKHVRLLRFLASLLYRFFRSSLCGRASET
jgi:hypothetical protein